MMTRKVTSRLTRPLPPTPLIYRQLKREFFSLPTNEPQTLTATRILPHKSSRVYSIIADIDRYSEFLPYCKASTVTKWSQLDSSGQRWPLEADLKIGWGGMEENFTSKLYLVPGSIVEAIGGSAATSIPSSTLQYDSTSLKSPYTTNEIFEILKTRWTVRTIQNKAPGRPPSPSSSSEHTEVQLHIEFQFSSPVYTALSRAATPKVAGIMIEAFERRANELLHNPASLLNTSRKASM